jgi:hypothetical protein
MRRCTRTAVKSCTSGAKNPPAGSHGRSGRHFSGLEKTAPIRRNFVIIVNSGKPRRTHPKSTQAQNKYILASIFPEHIRNHLGVILNRFLSFMSFLYLIMTSEFKLCRPLLGTFCLYICCAEVVDRLDDEK